VEQTVAVGEPEPALIGRAISRDSEAFGELYNLYFERIYRYIRLKVGNPADAEDVTAVVFLSAWRGIERFSPKHEASFSGWLFRLAHNALIDRYRRIRPTVSLDEALDESATEDVTLSPEASLEWRLTLAELRRALEALTEEQREVVLLRFVEGLSAREVGDIMGKQEGTVRGMQFRALEALRRGLARSQEAQEHERGRTSSR
jgi:RNA polymerase sigma-70 factor (ECF subfamily)